MVIALDQKADFQLLLPAWGRLLPHLLPKFLTSF